MNQITQLAPEFQVSQWLNSKQPIALTALRGRVVVLHAFQMLCPGCVTHGLPQATAIRRSFAESEVAVIGLHSVFEHHDVMGAAALEAFVDEYRLEFPIGIDHPAANSNIPLTMQAYRLRGTPSLILIDRSGMIRFHHFGRLDDLMVGGLIGQLVAGTSTKQTTGDVAPAGVSEHLACNENGCMIA